jgi:DNA-binding transcriptional ArsR family regulator
LHHRQVIEYRQLSMDVDRGSAEIWASWFRCLGDGTRVLILNRLAVARRPLSVGEIVAALDVGQSTVSHHLKILAEGGFVLVERRGTSGLYRVNERCLECFPSAADLVMGQLPRYGPIPTSCPAPWQPTGPSAEDAGQVNKRDARSKRRKVAVR